MGKSEKKISRKFWKYLYVMKIMLKETQVNKIFNYLNEDVKLAEKILKDNNIELNNPDYLKIKNDLLRHNMIGYLGLVVKLESSEGLISYGVARELLGNLINNKNLIKSLPKNIMSYKSSNELISDFKKIKKLLDFKKIMNKISLKTLKSQFDEKISDGSIYDIINNYDEYIENFNELSKESQNEFFKKLNRYQTIDQFFKGLINFINNYIGTYNGMLEKIKSVGEDDLKVLYADEEKGHIVVLVKTYKGSSSIGTTAWCIVGSEDQFNNYVKSGYSQYFFFNFDYNENIPTNLKMLAFTMDEDSNITASHDRYDKYYDDPLSYLRKIGISEKIFIINRRVQAEKSLSSTFQNKLIKDYENYEFGLSEYKSQIVKRIISLINNSIFERDNLDLLIKYIEEFKYKDIKVISVSKSEEIIKQNVITLLTDTKLESSYNDILIDFFKKVMERSIKMSSDTKYHINNFLHRNGVDVLSMGYNEKTRKGENLSDMEFAMLSNKGVNLKPMIQNKLSAIRRGEDVSMNVAEVKYAIDNGFKDIVKKHYLSFIDDYSINQLDYDDMQIYQKLGLLDKIKEIIHNKGKIYGVGTLNSIEKSLYDFEERRLGIK